MTEGGDREEDQTLGSRHARLKAAAEQAMSEEVVRVSFPGGESRNAIRCELASGQTVLASRRRNSQRRRHEIGISTALSEADAPAPRVLGVVDGVLVQEDLGDHRLNIALAEMQDEATREALVMAALESLARCKAAISQASIVQELPVKGKGFRWRSALAAVPTVLARMLDLRPPPDRSDPIAALLAVPEPRFVKWDARPGNAMVDEHGHVRWFDWDHAGLRNSVDDLVWLVCDEYVDLSADAEDAVLDRMVPGFGAGEDWSDYVRVMGAVHFSVRLHMILEHRLKSGKWWDFDYCCRTDRIGITQECALRTAQRALRWTRYVEQTKPLSDWYGRVAERISTLE